MALVRPPVRDYFPRHLDDQDTDVKRQAIWGTGYMGIAAEAARLRGMFDDGDFRHDALFAYALCVPGEISRGRIRGLLRKIETQAGGLSPAETELVEAALDQRLAMHGLDPVFAAGIEEEEEVTGNGRIRRDCSLSGEGWPERSLSVRKRQEI